MSKIYLYVELYDSLLSARVIIFFVSFLRRRAMTSMRPCIAA